ncbi:unnamed protein product [Chondrus crispus]|uniref:Uncharacterized protein n=1 Tax=Chondrus crispus TaxID=2769 RepID=R7Q673_CHOCR|nr:unnamed protein product [Chondrus crispus]CDF34022.1 unnamed protein product [Chondrus crispus]|eukprot:XP_005713841.1 unnamed protein product [Chondrus crispus]
MDALRRNSDAYISFRTTMSVSLSSSSLLRRAQKPLCTHLTFSPCVELDHPIETTTTSLGVPCTQSLSHSCIPFPFPIFFLSSFSLLFSSSSTTLCIRRQSLPSRDLGSSPPLAPVRSAVS